jgi:uridylate kinase
LLRARTRRILVCGHLPRSSTDYRSVLFARAIGADLIVNATDYGGVFDRDPSRHPDARRYRSLTYMQLEGIVCSRFEQALGVIGCDCRWASMASTTHLFDLDGGR